MRVDQEKMKKVEDLMKICMEMEMEMERIRGEERNEGGQFGE